MKPLVDVVVLNYNGWRHTIECLESLLRSDYPAFRVIVADNKSTDDSLIRIREWLNGAPLPFAAAEIPESLRHYVVPSVPKPVAFVEGDADTAFDVDGAKVIILRVARNAGF